MKSPVSALFCSNVPTPTPSRSLAGIHMVSASCIIQPRTTCSSPKVLCPFLRTRASQENCTPVWGRRLSGFACASAHLFAAQRLVTLDSSRLSSASCSPYSRSRRSTARCSLSYDLYRLCSRPVNRATLSSLPAALSAVRPSLLPSHLPFRTHPTMFGKHRMRLLIRLITHNSQKVSMAISAPGRRRDKRPPSSCAPSRS